MQIITLLPWYIIYVLLFLIISAIHIRRVIRMDVKIEDNIIREQFDEAYILRFLIGTALSITFFVLGYLFKLVSFLPISDLSVVYKGNFYRFLLGFVFYFPMHIMGLFQLVVSIKYIKEGYDRVPVLVASIIMGLIPILHLLLFIIRIITFL